MKTLSRTASRLADQARNEPDPEIRRIQLIAIERYYQRDVRQREPFFATLGAILATYLIVVGTAFYVFRNYSFLVAVAVVIAALAFVALLVGASFRAAGYISESSFMGIFYGGVRLLLFLRKQTDGETGWSVRRACSLLPCWHAPTNKCARIEGQGKEKTLAMAGVVRDAPSLGYNRQGDQTDIHEQAIKVVPACAKPDA